MVSESQKLPGPRCREMVDGGVMSFPCMLDLGHIGPHEAVEVPASGRRRQLWLEENVSEQQPVTASQPQQEQPSPSVDIRQTVIDLLMNDASVRQIANGEVSHPVLDIEHINPQHVREQAVMAVLNNRDINALPAAVSSWATGMVSMTSLSALWMMAQEHFNNGHSAVVLTKEFVEKLVPTQIRPAQTDEGE